MPSTLDGARSPAGPRVRSPRTSAGLSLLELVVVIAIILILAALLLTAAARIYKAVKALGGEQPEPQHQQPVTPSGPR